MGRKIKIAIILFFLAFTCLFSITTVRAQNEILQNNKKTEFTNNLNNFADQASIEREKSLETMIATAIKIVLASLGTMFIVLMFVAGNSWMQAAGNEEKIKKSKARIQSLIVGLVIIMIAYALSSGFSGLLSSVLLK